MNKERNRLTQAIGCACIMFAALVALAALLYGCDNDTDDDCESVGLSAVAKPRPPAPRAPAAKAPADKPKAPARKAPAPRFVPPVVVAPPVQKSPTPTPTAKKKRPGLRGLDLCDG